MANEIPSEEKLKELKRNALQNLAKKHNIKANLASAKIIEQLITLKWLVSAENEAPSIERQASPVKRKAEEAHDDESIADEDTKTSKKRRAVPRKPPSRNARKVPPRKDLGHAVEADNAAAGGIVGAITRFPMKTPQKSRPIPSLDLERDGKLHALQEVAEREIRFKTRGMKKVVVEEGLPPAPPPTAVPDVNPETSSQDPAPAPSRSTNDNLAVLSTKDTASRRRSADELRCVEPAVGEVPIVCDTVVENSRRGDNELGENREPALHGSDGEVRIRERMAGSRNESRVNEVEGVVQHGSQEKEQVAPMQDKSRFEGHSISKRRHAIPMEAPAQMLRSPIAVSIVGPSVDRRAANTNPSNQKAPKRQQEAPEAGSHSHVSLPRQQIAVPALSGHRFQDLPPAQADTGRPHRTYGTQRLQQEDTEIASPEDDPYEPRATLAMSKLVMSKIQAVATALDGNDPLNPSFPSCPAAKARAMNALKLRERSDRLSRQFRSESANLARLKTYIRYWNPDTGREKTRSGPYRKRRMSRVDDEEVDKGAMEVDGPGPITDEELWGDALGSAYHSGLMDDAYSLN